MLLSQKFVETLKTKIIVVVDGSNDGTLEALLEFEKKLVIVLGTGNWWYTKSINEGLKSARESNPDFYLLLNDDIHIENNFLSNLIVNNQQIQKDCLLGTISVSIENPPRITFSGVRNAPKFPYQRTHYIPFMSKVDLADMKGYVPSQELPGRGMLIPKKVIDEVGLFDEKFPQYFSDLDFSRRAKKKGFPVFVSYEAVTYSHVEKTSDSTTFKPISNKKFIKNLSNPYGRKHLGQIARYVWRHYPKPGFPFYYFRWVSILFYNHFKVNVLKITHAA
jgi:GT2 family glycosyltransferase